MTRQYDGMDRIGLQAVVEQATDGILISDSGGTIQYANPAFSGLTGYSCQELVGSHVSLFMLPGRVHLLDTYLKTIRQGESIPPFDTVLRAKNDDEVVLSLSIFPLRDVDGAVVGASVIARDIRTSLQVTQKLHESEEHFRRVFEYAPFGVCDMTLDGHYTLVNPAFCSMVGYSEAELQTMTWMDLTPLDDTPAFQEMLEELSQTPAQFLGLERCYRHHDGSDLRVNLKVSLVRDGQGRPLHLVVHVDDLTERQRTAAALEESEIRFRRIFENNGSVMLFIDAATAEIAAANYAAAEYYGYGREELVGLSLGRISAKPHAEVSIQLHRALREKQICFDTRHKTASGEEHDVEVHASSIDLDGKPMLFSIVHDVSERRRVEAALADSESRFRKFFEENGLAMLLIDPEQQEIVDANHAALKFYGYPREQMIGLSMSRINTQSDAEIARERQRAIQQGRAFFHFQHQLAGGDVREMECYFSLLALNGKTVQFTILIDVTERKRSEARMMDLSERLTLATRASGVGVWFYDLALDRIVWDEQMCRLYDLPDDSFQGTLQQSMAMVHPEERERLANEIQRSLQGARSMDFEYRIVWPDGSIHSILSHAYGQRGVSGRVERIIGTNADITAQKEAEAKLRESEQRYRATFEQAAVGIVHTSLEGKLLRCNARFAEILNYDPEELPGLSFNQITRTEDAAATAGMFSQSMNAASTSLEQRCIRKDGSLTWARFTSSAQRDEQGCILHFITLVEDINARKLAEAHLQEARERSAELQQAILHLELEKTNNMYRLILDAAGDGIYGLDADGVTTFANPSSLAMLGYTEEGLVGKPQHTLVHYAYPDGTPYPREECLIYKALRDGKVHSCDTEVFWRKDGSSIPVAYTSTPILRDGKPDGAVVVFQEISERKQLERADAANRAKSEFLANMSHEIRTPMNGILGITNLLLDTNLDQSQRSYAETVRDCGDTMLSLINDILDFSKIEAGRLDLESLNFDLQAMLDDLVAVLAVRAHKKGLDMLCEVDAAVPPLLCGDVNRLRQIITNLMGNAIKFTSTGEVELHVELTEEREDNVLLRFTTRDTGIGIPANKVGVLFNKFSQVDSSTTRIYGGTGLGLAISKQLVELMGGDVGVTSEEGKGSKFWFTARFAKQQIARNEAFTACDLQGIRALVVEDNAATRNSIQKRLEAAGLRVSQAESYPGALQALYGAITAGDTFRFVLIDEQLPHENAGLLVRAIQADQQLCNVRMVLLEAIGSAATSPRLPDDGTIAYLPKPVRSAELFCALSTLHSNSLGPGKQNKITEQTAATEPALFTSLGARILLTEDNPTNQTVALGILRKLGLKADVANNGIEAIRALERQAYDLVLMDVQMPLMDGITATRQIRGESSTAMNPRVPIIAMTAHARTSDRDKCLEAGMDDYVSKPVSPKLLTEALQRWLPQSDDKPSEIKAGEAPAGGAPDGAPVVFDRAGMLERLMDDQDLADAVIEAFLADTPHQLEALRSLTGLKDLQGAQTRAHTIKGASSSIGGEELRALALEMEMACQQGNLEFVAAHLDELELRFVRLKGALTNKG